MQDDTSEAPIERHLERLDACSEGRKEVQDIARAREAAASVEPMRIGAMKGNCVSSQGTCVQHWHRNDENSHGEGTMEPGQCSHCQRNGHVRRLCWKQSS